MRLAEYYSQLQKEAVEASPETEAKTEDLDKVALATDLVSAMSEEEQVKFAEALGLGKQASEENAETDGDLVKQAEDIFTAGRIFARGLLAEAQGEG